MFITEFTKPVCLAYSEPVQSSQIHTFISLRVVLILSLHVCLSVSGGLFSQNILANIL
jgi:hypothetical protein